MSERGKDMRERTIDTFAARNLKLPSRILPTESAEYYGMMDSDELDNTIVEILDTMDKDKKMKK